MTNTTWLSANAYMVEQYTREQTMFVYLCPCTANLTRSGLNAERSRLAINLSSLIHVVIRVFRGDIRLSLSDESFSETIARSFCRILRAGQEETRGRHIASSGISIFPRLGLSPSKYISLTVRVRSIPSAGLH